MRSSIATAVGRTHSAQATISGVVPRPAGFCASRRIVGAFQKGVVSARVAAGSRARWREASSPRQAGAAGRQLKYADVAVDRRPDERRLSP
jgi:hypothetical protein